MSRPKLGLAALHGEGPKPPVLFLTYLSGGVGAALALLARGGEGLAAGLLPNLVLGLVALDLFAGAVANQSEATRSWYRERPAGLRFLFLALHLVQPALLAAVVEPSAWAYLGAAWLWAFFGGSLVLALRGKELREAAAGAVFALGTAFCLAVFEPAGGLAWFAPVFLGKLVLGFALGTGRGRDSGAGGA